MFPMINGFNLLIKQVETYGIEGKKLLDLACGTGELSIRLAEEGYDVTGVDLSSDMLAVAREKAIEGTISFFSGTGYV